MTPTHDTIAAIATAPARGAIGIIRISGAAAPRIAAELMGNPPAPRSASLRRFLDADGSVIDEGLALYFPAPHSFTGEPVLELHAHGGLVMLDRLLRRVLALGARMARPGEFTERAFLNDKLDLAQAEAIADLIDAATEAAAKAAVRSMQGEFSRRIHELQTRLTHLRVHVEATIDFPEEDIEVQPSVWQESLAGILSTFDAIEAAARQGSLLREGIHVVIAGRPNAGKSTLLNRLAGDAVAIVTATPGTTRDVLRQTIHLDGLPVNLLDTAGLREAADEAEAEGVRRARAAMERADRVLYVVDGSVPAAAPDEFEAPPGVPVTRIVNKVDLLGAAPRVHEDDAGIEIHLSAHTGAGIELLRDHLKESAGYRDVEAGGFSARRRHLDALQRARAHVASAARVLQESGAQELSAEDLRLAQRALGEITGEFGSEDLLAAIFSSFCIGK
jgi:tRNA modification GTPase